MKQQKTMQNQVALRRMVWWLPMAGLVFVTGCGREQVEVYEIPKEGHGQSLAAASGASAAPAVREEPKFEVPEAWEELPSSGMRVASFQVAGEGGKQAEVVVIPLPGVEGGPDRGTVGAQSVNLWRQDLGLEPLPLERVQELAESVQVGEAEGRLYDLESAATGEGGKRRILGAVVERPGTTWFFKMSGPSEVVSQQGASFREFLTDVRFGAAMPAPALAGGPDAVSANAGRLSGRAAVLPLWDVPEHWTEQPGSSMRLGSFAVAGEEGTADISVTRFPGDVGGLLANINRWRGQIGLEPIAENKLAEAVVALELAEGTGKLADMVSADGQTRMLVGIVPRGGQTWFYKMTGPEALVSREKDGFVKFVETAEYPNG